MRPGAMVLLHLMEPSEKYWGVLEAIELTGVTLRGINLSSFDDWISSVIHESPPSLGLATVFFPLRRVESMFVDERVGTVESLGERFERRAGMSVGAHLGLHEADETSEPS